MCPGTHVSCFFLFAATVSPALHWKFAKIQVIVFELKKQSKWENVPPWKQISCCECSSSVAGVWSWMFCGVRGSGGSCRAWELHDWALEIPADVSHQTWYSEVALKLSSCTCSYCGGAHSSWKEKLKVMHEVKIPPFPTTRKGKQRLPCPRPAVAGVAHLLFPCFPHGERECRLLRAAVAHLWLAGHRATCQLHWGDYELSVSTFNAHQAPVLFVSPVSPSAILIASTFHIWLQLQAVMLQRFP